MIGAAFQPVPLLHGGRLHGSTAARRPTETVNSVDAMPYPILEGHPPGVPCRRGSGAGRPYRTACVKPLISSSERRRAGQCSELSIC